MESNRLEWRRLPRIEPNLNLKISLTLLRYIGNWPPRGNLRKYYYVYTLLCFTLLIAIYLFVQTAFMIAVWGDLERMIAGSFLLMTNTGNCYKMIMILLQRDRIQSLVDLVSSEIFNSNNARFERILSIYTWQGIFHHAAYQSLGGVSICCWALASIMNIITGRERHLPVESWYPYDVLKSPNFEITCAQQIIGEMILCFHNIALDTLVTNFINVACCQLEILKKNVESIGSEDDENVATRKRNDEACEQLNFCIEHNKAIIYLNLGSCHVLECNDESVIGRFWYFARIPPGGFLIEFLVGFEFFVELSRFRFKKEIQDIFGTSILYQCFVNCAIICLTAFHISRMNDYVPAELMGTALYLCGMTYQIFIYCWHGNELALHSESVALAAYSSNWWKFDERYKSTLRILMIRSRKPLILTVGRIMILSLETFTSILRMSYSLFTVLQNSTTD